MARSVILFFAWLYMANQASVKGVTFMRLVCISSRHDVQRSASRGLEMGLLESNWSEPRPTAAAQRKHTALSTAVELSLSSTYIHVDHAVSSYCTL